MELQPLHTKIDKSMQSALGTIVLENHSGFPRYESNLYCIAPSGKMVWKAEKPDTSTLFSRVKLNEDGDTISAYTIGGHACELELRTGKLISHTVIK
jgi:hypothetical protein